MKRSVIVFVVVLIGITLLSCGKPNPLSPPAAEVQQVINFSDEKITTSSGEFIYRQTIYLNELEGCEYSYRVQTVDNSLPTGMTVDPDGWLYFPNPCYTDEELLLEPPDHHIVWTNKSRISLDFYSTDAKVSNLVTKVEVRVKSPNGSINHYESPYKSDRLISSRIIVPFSNGAVTGTGIEFKMVENPSNIYVEGMFAHHFMYRLNKLDMNYNTISSGEWHNSINSPDIRTVVLNGQTTPAITVTPNEITEFECYVVSRLGVEESSHQLVKFIPTSGNKPTALIYPESIVGLGSYHQSFSGGSVAFNEQIPSSEQNGTNSLLWGGDGSYYAINSNDFKLHFRWGYNGEYNSNDPFQLNTNVCLNEQGQSYYSTIVAYDLRWDGAPFPIQPGFFEPEQVTHTDGSTWLRVKNMLDSCRHIIMQQIANGTHTFAVCAVDNQFVYSEPASISITLNPYKPQSQRSGILIVDDSAHHNSNSPEQTVDAFYNAVIPSTWGTVNSFDLAELNTGTLPLGSTLLQNYKAVVWHSDNPSSTGKLPQNTNALRFYLSHGGNLLISGTSKLLQDFQALANGDYELYHDYLGINGNIAEWAGTLGTSLTNNPFFYQAIGLNGLANIDLETTNSFNSIVNSRDGLGVVTYFNPGTGSDFLYKLGCKTPGMDNFSPTQEQYELYSSKYVAYKHSYLGSNVVVFGFPLSYMEQADVSSALQNIFGGILGTKVSEGRK
jgi:hypothetical protein